MSEPIAPKDRIRDAATVIAIRRDGPEPRLLMGQRGAGAAFMPSKFVFPGGAVDADDRAVAAFFPPPETLAHRLGLRPREGGEVDPLLGAALALAAVRELWEETGLTLGRTAAGLGGTPLPEAWSRFCERGRTPACEGLDLVFRAITPPGRPRRFDARFLMVDADLLTGDLDDFGEADQELAHLSWLTLAEARRLDLPFITEIVLAEVEERLAEGPGASDRPAPFFHHDGGRSFIDPL